MSAHRAPNQPLVRLTPRHRILLAAATVAALLLAAVWQSGATAESAMSQLELAQVTQRNCQVLLAKATSSAQRTRARQCIADQQVIIDALSSPTPSPSATQQTASPSPSPTVAPSPTVSPTATTTPAPTPTASPTPTGTLTNCLGQLATCGFPNALNTGPSGTLAASTRTQYSTAGETIRDVEIRGCVEVRAANVTFRNVRFNAAGCFWGVRNFGLNDVLEDVEITCGDTPGSNGFSNAFSGSPSATLRRADIHNCENGLNVPGETTVLDSWIHGLYDGGDAHTDGAQFNQGASNIRFEHNVIDARGNTTSAIIMWDESDPQNAHVTIADNLMAGGSYTLYCGRSGTAVDVNILRNRFGPYTYGSSNSCNTGGEVWSGNVRDDTGAALAAA